MNIGFIGAGKVGCTLGKYFAKSPQVALKGYYSRSGSSARDAAHFTDSESYATMEELIRDCDIIFLTVPDGSIQDTWKRVREYDIRGKTICHCSGAMSSQDAFCGIESTGAFGYSVHPLFAVSDRYNAYRELTGVFFTLEGGSGLADIRGLLDELGNPYRTIKAEDKITYHCAAAMASNLVCGLIDQSIALMKRCGFAEDEAVKALAPILMGNMDHIAQKGPTASLTGPIERDDIETVRKHLNCLADVSEKALYSLLSSRLIRMAQDRHPYRDYTEMRSVLAADEKSGKDR